MAREVIDIIIQERGGRVVSDRIREVGRQARTAEGGVMLLRRALSGLAGSLVVREIIRAVDSYQRMRNELSILGYSSIQAQAGMQRLYQTAQDTRAPIEQLVSLYGKLGQANRELGRSEEQMMEFTRAAGLALSIAGTAGNQARGALIQLNQAMGEGIVRAQEYNSMVENMRPLLLAAATGIDEAGGSISRLRQMVVDGRLTSQMFFDGVLNGAHVLEEQFAGTTATIGQSFQRLTNAWTMFMGESAAGQIILSAVTGVLYLLADNLELIGSAALIAGTLYGTWFIGGALARGIGTIYGAVAAQTALNVSLGATGFSATLAGGALKYLRAQVYLLTAAILANPFGALAAAIVAVIALLYSMRNVMVTIGEHTASLGNIAAVVWDRMKAGISSVWEAFSTWVSNGIEASVNWATNVIGDFDWIAETARSVVNILIAVFKSFVDITLGNFRTLYRVAIAVLRGLANVGRSVLSGLANAVTGNFSDAAQNFRDAFSAESFDMSGVTASIEQTAATVAENFSTDWVETIGDGIERGRQAIVESFSGIMAEAAARGREEIEEPFEFITGGTDGFQGNGGSGGRNRRSRDQTTFAQEMENLEREIELERQWGLQKEINNRILKMEEQLKRSLSDAERQSLADAVERLEVARMEGQILNDLRGPQEQLAIRQEALNNLIARGAIEQAEYNRLLREFKMEAGQASFADAFIYELERMRDASQSFAQSAGTIFGNFFNSLTKGIANSIGRAIVYAEDLDEALSNVAKEALSQLISAFIELGIQYLINQAIAATAGAAATATSAAMAATTASAWAPAAAMASLASMGANAAPANAALAGTVASARALALKDGGYVSGPGTGRSDSINALLSNGEFVINAEATASNRELLEAINSGQSVRSLFPGFKDGGMFGGDVSQKSLAIVKSAEYDAQTTERAQGRYERDSDPVDVDASVQIVNVLDPAIVGDYLQSEGGRRVILNVLGEEGVV